MPSLILSTIFSYATLGYVTKYIRAGQHQSWFKMVPYIQNTTPVDMNNTIQTVSTVEGLVWPKTLYRYINDPQFRINDPEQWTEERRQRLQELCTHSTQLHNEYQHVKRLLSD